MPTAITFAPNDPTHIASLLKQAEIPVLSVAAITDEADGLIEVTATIRIQVGESYLTLVEEADNQFAFTEAHSLSDLVAKLKAKLEGIYVAAVLNAFRSGNTAILAAYRDLYQDLQADSDDCPDAEFVERCAMLDFSDGLDSLAYPDLPSSNKSQNTAK